MTPEATNLPQSAFSLKNKIPIKTANITDVSRRAATKAIGAIVIAQTAIQYAKTDAKPATKPKTHTFVALGKIAQPRR